MNIVKEGHCSLGYCYIEDTGTGFIVHIGSNEYGTYSSFKDALALFTSYCG